MVNERLAFLDISNRGIWARIVSAYFPHSGYSDAHIQSMYTALSAIHKEALSHKYHFILAGDFNAEVGSRLDSDSSRVVGPCGLHSENSRGQWLKQWATLENLVITNTFFSKPMQSRMTHVGPSGHQRQIDFILVDRPCWRKVRDSGSVEDIDMGPTTSASTSRWTCAAVQKRLNTEKAMDELLGDASSPTVFWLSFHAEWNRFLTLANQSIKSLSISRTL